MIERIFLAVFASLRKLMAHDKKPKKKKSAAGIAPQASKTSGIPRGAARNVVTLRSVAAYVGLDPSTVSVVLNDTAPAQAIPQHTKDRIFAAVRELNYQPNFFARSLRKQRTYTIGVIAEEIGDIYGSMVISGIEEHLSDKGYFFLTVTHRHRRERLERYSQLLLQRAVEGLITVDTAVHETPPLPTVAVAGHNKTKGVTNVVLDQKKAAQLALQYLTGQGHERIAFMRGPTVSSDADERWGAISTVARAMGLHIDRDLVIQIEDSPTPQPGYVSARLLLERKKPFTALFAYNDLAAIGAIRAFQERGLRVPGDISVMGFDDITGAEFHTPSLTTVRQPLRAMGRTAAEALLQKIEHTGKPPAEIAIEPELLVRESTAAVSKS
ncbi:MAG: LacI family DNA-binding transcriptional regulator [Candidatus Acidiferrales bacterium]